MKFCYFGGTLHLFEDLFLLQVHAYCLRIDQPTSSKKWQASLVFTWVYLSYSDFVGVTSFCRRTKTDVHLCLIYSTDPICSLTLHSQGVINQTRGRTSRHRKMSWKTRRSRAFYHPIRGVRIPDETFFRVFDVIHQTRVKAFHQDFQTRRGWKTRRSRVLFLTHFEAFGYLIMQTLSSFWYSFSKWSLNVEKTQG